MHKKHDKRPHTTPPHLPPATPMYQESLHIPQAHLTLNTTNLICQINDLNSIVRLQAAKIKQLEDTIEQNNYVQPPLPPPRPIIYATTTQRGGEDVLLPKHTTPPYFYYVKA
jgi:hypothetical protein